MLAFLDLEGNQKTLLVRIIFGQRGHHLHIGETVAEVKAADQVAIGLDAVGVVDVVTAEKAQQARFAGLDDVLQAIGRIDDVADEFDRFDSGFLTLGDRKDQIDAVVRLLDDLPE